MLAEGEREARWRRRSRSCATSADEGRTKDVAGRVWWISEVFGPDAAGGAEEVQRAKELLERTKMLQAFREPELVTSRSAVAEA